MNTKLRKATSQHTKSLPNNTTDVITFSFLYFTGAKLFPGFPWQWMICFPHSYIFSNLIVLWGEGFQLKPSKTLLHGGLQTAEELASSTPVSMKARNLNFGLQGSWNWSYMFFLHLHFQMYQINGGKISAPANRPIINVTELEITPVPIFTTNIKSGRALQEGPNSIFRYNRMSSIVWQQKRKARAEFYLKVKYLIKIHEANLNLSMELLSHRLAFSSLVIDQKWFLLKLYWILEFHFTLMPSNHLNVWMKQSIWQLLRSPQSILFLCNFLYFPSPCMKLTSQCILLMNHDHTLDRASESSKFL